MKLITLLFMFFISISSFSQGTNADLGTKREMERKAVESQKEWFRQMDSVNKANLKPKDSAKVETPLLNFQDVMDLETFMKENLLIKDMPIFNGVLDWLRKRVQQKAQVYNSKLK